MRCTGGAPLPPYAALSRSLTRAHAPNFFAPCIPKTKPKQHNKRYASSSLDPRCTSETIDKFYEVLELFAYEVHAEVHRASPHAVKYKNIHTTRLMTVLISALGKLGAVTPTRFSRGKITQNEASERRGGSLRLLLLCPGQCSYR